MDVRAVLSTAVRLVCTILLVLALGGCENTIEPFSEDESYSVHGYLSLSRDTQFVRVRSLDRTLAEDAETSLNATVTLENLDSGATYQMQDSVIVFRDRASAVTTHNFWVDLSVQPDTRYRLTVEGAEGTTQATTLTPEQRDITPSPTGGNCLTPIDVEFKGVDAPRRVRAAIEFQATGDFFRDSQTRFVRQSRDGPATLTFRMEEVLCEYVARQDEPRTPCLYESRCSLLDRGSVTLRYTILGPEWYGNAPRDTVPDPTTSPRVTNGLGFFGSVRRGGLQVDIDASGNGIDICGEGTPDPLQCPDAP